MDKVNMHSKWNKLKEKQTNKSNAQNNTTHEYAYFTEISRFALLRFLFYFQHQ